VAVENVVGVGIPFAAFVCISQCRYHGSINVTQNVGEVTRYIVAPELATLEFTNCRSKLLKVYTSLTLSNFLPVNVLGARFSVATFIVERAGCRAGLTAAGAGGDGASLGVAGNQGECSVHRFGVVNLREFYRMVGPELAPVTKLNAGLPSGPCSSPSPRCATCGSGQS